MPTSDSRERRESERCMEWGARLECRLGKRRGGDDNMSSTLSAGYFFVPCLEWVQGSGPHTIASTVNLAEKLD